MRKGLLLFLTFFIISCSKDDVYQVMKYNSTSEYIAIFGDIQYYTNSSYYLLYENSCNWILAQKHAGMHIKCVLHTGDVTQSNTGGNWWYFQTATQKLASEIPYVSAIGDHDYTWDDNGLIHDRYSTFFNDYVNFPLTKQNVVAYFEKGRMENIIVENHIHGLPIYFLVLEFGPRKEVVDWANEYVRNHSDINFILMTHEYLEYGGGRRTQNLKMVSRLQNTTYTKPDDLWNQLVKCNNNILCVFCGHVLSLYACTPEKNDFGRDVYQIQYNIQDVDYRYDNWLMLWEFPDDSEYVNVMIFNASTMKFFNNQSTLFRFKYRNIIE